MKLVINIDEKDLENLKIYGVFSLSIYTLLQAALNGTPLPKGHGRLADLDAALKCIEETADCNEKYYAMCLFDWAMSKRVVLEADKEEVNK